MITSDTNEYTLKAYVINTGEIDLHNVDISIELPPEISLISGKLIQIIDLLDDDVLLTCALSEPLLD